MATATQLLRIVIKADNQASGELGKVGKKAKGIGDTFKSVGASMTKNFTLPILGLGVIMAKPFIEFDKQLVNFEARTGSTADQMEIIRAKALQLGRDTAFSPSSAMEGMLELAASGATVEETLVQIESVLNLAAAGMLDLGVASDGLTDVMAGMRLEVKDTVRVTDLLVAGSQKSSATVQDMIDGFVKVGPILATYGISIEEGAAAMAVLSEAGMKGVDAGQALKRALSQMNRGTAKSIGAWRALGTTMFDAQGVMKPLDQLLDEINAGLADKSAEERTQILTNLVGVQGLAGTSALLAAGGLDTMAASLKEAQTAEQVAQKQLESFSGQLTILRGSFERLSILVIGPFMKEVLVPLIQKATEIANKFADWSEDNEALSSTIVKIVAGLALMGPAISLIGFALTPLINLFKIGKAVMLAWRAAALTIVPLTNAMSVSFTGVAAASTSAWIATLGPIAAVIAAIVAVGIAVAALIDHFGGLKNIATGVTDFLKLSFDGWRAIFDTFSKALVKGIKNLANIGKLMGEIGFGLIKALAMGMFKGAQAVMGAVEDIGNAVVGGIKDVFGIASPSKVMAQVGTDVSDGFKEGLFQALSDAGNNYTRAIGEEFRVAEDHPLVTEFFNNGKKVGNAFNLGVNSSMRSLQGGSPAAFISGQSGGVLGGSGNASSTLMSRASQAGLAFLRQNAPGLLRGRENQMRDPTNFDPNTQLPNLTIGNINVPPGTSEEQIDFIMRAIARRMQAQGQSGRSNAN